MPALNGKAGACCQILRGLAAGVGAARDGRPNNVAGCGFIMAANVAVAQGAGAAASNVTLTGNFEAATVIVLERPHNEPPGFECWWQEEDGALHDATAQEETHWAFATVSASASTTSSVLKRRI